MLSECRDAIQAVREELKSDQVGLSRVPGSRSSEVPFGPCVSVQGRVSWPPLHLVWRLADQQEKPPLGSTRLRDSFPSVLLLLMASCFTC